MTHDDRCPQCGGELERDEADVGVGVIYGPAGCPACFWTEDKDRAIANALASTTQKCGARMIHGDAGERCGEVVTMGQHGFWKCPTHGDTVTLMPVHGVTASVLSHGHPPLEALKELAKDIFVPAASRSDCSTCRYAGTHKRPKIMEETGFGDQLMFEDADKDETVYTCKAFVSEADGTLTGRFDPGALCEHAGKEIGLVPITCEAWTQAKPKKSARLEELDRKIAEREARAAKRESK